MELGVYFRRSEAHSASGKPSHFPLFMSSLDQTLAALGAAFCAVIAQVAKEAADNTAKFEQRIAELEALGDEYVDTKMALRILGVGKSWLERERHKPGTLLVVSYAGSKPTYSRASLYAAKAARTPKIHATSRPYSTRVPLSEPQDVRMHYRGDIQA